MVIALSCMTIGLALAAPAADQPWNLSPQITVAGTKLAVPTPAQVEWQEHEVGMFIHMAPQTWQDSETDTMKTPLWAMNPEKLDVAQWVRVAESMGAKYIVFVAKHEGGFCWWPTTTTDHCVRNIPWRAGKGDVLADLSVECAKRKMKLGVYISPQDRIHGVGVGGKASDPAKQGEYEKLFRAQLTEVLSTYGRMCEVWFDGSLVFDVGDILKQHAPDAAIFQGPHATIRWVGNEAGVVDGPAWNAVRSGDKKWGDYTTADAKPDGDRWLPNECDARIRATWFWRTDNAKTLKSVDALMTMYEASVGRGGVLLLNNTPDRSGLIPDEDARRSAEFGAMIKRRYDVAMISSAGTVEEGKDLTVTLSAPRAIDRVMLQEDIAQGERVREYVIEALKPGAPESGWEIIAKGTAIGYKRIEVLAEPMTVAKVRLRVVKTVGEARIAHLAVFGPKLE